MEEAGSSERYVPLSTRRHVPEDSNGTGHGREYLKYQLQHSKFVPKGEQASRKPTQNNRYGFRDKMDVPKRFLCHYTSATERNPMGQPLPHHLTDLTLSSYCASLYPPPPPQLSKRSARTNFVRPRPDLSILPQRNSVT
jgi:hypothetical protein